MKCEHCRKGNVWTTERRSWAPGWTSWKCLDCDKLSHVRAIDLPADLQEVFQVDRIRQTREMAF